jgi:hypothetical protein
METNIIHYTCECGRAWKRLYLLQIEGENLVFSRIVRWGAPPSDSLCSCGKIAEARLETPMPGYRRGIVRLLILVREKGRYSDEEREQQYEELVQALIEREHPITLDQVEAIEARAAKIIEVGLTAAEWEALSAEQQAEALKHSQL